MGSVESRPWRAIIRVEQVRGGSVILVVPGWSSRERIELKKDDLPEEVVQLCDAGPVPPWDNVYMHARVNIGAERKEDLRFSEWETS